MNIETNLNEYDTCQSCNLTHSGVDGNGIFGCPNPFCHGSGGSYFRSKLKSFKEINSSEHTVDEEEWHFEALKHLEDKPELVKLIKEQCNDRGNPFSRKCNYNYIEPNNELDKIFYPKKGNILNKLIGKSNFKNYKEKIILGLYLLAKTADMIVFFGSLTYFSSEFGRAIIFNETLDDWINK